MTHEEMLSVATRVVHHASELPPTPEVDGPNVLRLTVEDLKAIVVSALRELEEDVTASR